MTEFSSPVTVGSSSLCPSAATCLITGEDQSCLLPQGQEGPSPLGEGNRVVVGVSLPPATQQGPAPWHHAHSLAKHH